jgi:hypothetical protein
MESEATKAVEKRIGRLLKACGDKSCIRASIMLWYINYTTSDEYFKLSKQDKEYMIRMYTGIILFFE